jgi:nucleotide-binding universal stress UspA family protein
MYQKILVPLDGSELAECVLPHVETLAKGCQAKSVVFLRVAEPPHPTASELPTSAISAGSEVELFTDEEREQISRGTLSASEDYLNRLVNRIRYDGGVSIQSEVIGGNVKAAESIADYATKNEVDLIIIATHGRSGVSRWVWGSVADRILRSACVPVLMVRAPGCIPGI